LRYNKELLLRDKKQILRNLTVNKENSGQMLLKGMFNYLSPKLKKHAKAAAAAEESIQGLDDPELLDEPLWNKFYQCKIDDFKKLLPENIDEKFKLLNSHNKIFKLRPIIVAIHTNWLEMVEYLLEEGVDVNSFTEQGELIPLIEAVRCNVFEIVKLLVDKGAEILESDNQGETPWLLAYKLPDKKIFNFLSDTINKHVENDGLDSIPRNSASLGRSQPLAACSDPMAPEQYVVQPPQTRQPVNGSVRPQQSAANQASTAEEQRAFDPDTLIPKVYNKPKKAGNVDITQFFDLASEDIYRETLSIEAMEPKLSPLELHHAKIELDWLYIIKNQLGKYNQESKQVLSKKLLPIMSIRDEGFTRLVDAYVDHLYSSHVSKTSSASTNILGR
jgi:hypothetical protein